MDRLCNEKSKDLRVEYETQTFWQGLHRETTELEGKDMSDMNS